MYNLSNRSKDRLAGTHPVILPILEAAITNSPFDFGIPQNGGLRTLEDQQGLYAIGRTVEVGRKPVTHTDGIRKKSNHQAKADGNGWAFDIYIYLAESKRASWDVEKLTAVANHIKEVAADFGVLLTWGGDWKSWKDYPHFEIDTIL